MTQQSPSVKIDLAAISPTYSIWRTAPAQSGRAFYLFKGHDAPTHTLVENIARTAQVAVVSGTNQVGATLRALVSILEDIGEPVQSIIFPRDREHNKIPLSYHRVKHGRVLDLYKVKGGVPNTTMFLTPSGIVHDAPPGMVQTKDTLLAAYRRTAVPPDTAWALFRLINGDVE